MRRVPPGGTGGGRERRRMRRGHARGGGRGGVRQRASRDAEARLHGERDEEAKRWGLQATDEVGMLRGRGRNCAEQETDAAGGTGGERASRDAEEMLWGQATDLRRICMIQQYMDTEQGPGR